MIKGLIKRTAAAVLAVVMMSSVFTGCGQDGKSIQTGQSNQEKGRYVEKEMTLPEGVTAQEIFQLDRQDGNLCIYTRAEADGMSVLKRYIYDDSGSTWKEDTPAWLEAVQIPYREYGVVKVLKGDDKAEYLYSVYEEGENYLGHLFAALDGTTAADITPEAWKKPHPEYNFYEYPQDVAILADNTVVAQFYSGTILYNGTDGSEIKNKSLDKYYSEKIYGMGDKYALLLSDDLGNTAGIDIFDANNENPVSQYPYNQKAGSYSYLDTIDDKTIVLCDATGIYTFDTQNAAAVQSGIIAGEDGSGWKQIIKGSYTSLSMASMYVKNIKALENGKYYILYGEQGNQPVLMEYVYDPEVLAEASKELKIYSVYPNSTLQQAAALFHVSNPDIIVTIESGATQEEQYGGEADVETITKSLNAQLMTEDAPDILIMDDLNITSFISKGLLADISDVVTPMEESGEVLSNITSTFKTEDGKMFSVPARFYITLVLGKEIDAEKISDLASLAKEAAASKDSLLGSRTAEELATEFLPFFMADIIDGKVLNKEALKENLEYLKAIGDNCKIVENYGDRRRGYNMWELPAYTQAAIQRDEGFAQAMLPLSIVKLVNGTFSSFQDAFYPALQAGINTKSENIDIAKEFIAFLLSEEVQKSDFYDGFPVNAAALEYQKSMDRSDYVAATSIEIAEGMSQEFTIDQFDEAAANRLTELCKSVNKKVTKDKKVEQEIIAAIPEYLSGNQTVEDTIVKIEESLRMYLAE